MRIAVTGASGFVGRNFLKSATAVDQVVAFYHSDTSFVEFVQSLGRSNVTCCKCDLADTQALKAALKEIGDGFDCCLYLAAQGDPAASAVNPLDDLQRNAVALVNFLSQALVDRVVFMSSGAVYDGLEGAVGPEVAVAPTLPYAISKLASEHYVRFFAKRNPQRSYVILRFFGAYGPYELSRKVYRRLVQRFHIEKDDHFEVRGDGRNLIDAMYVGDTVDALHKVICSKVSNVTVDFCSGTPRTIDALIREAAATFGISEPAIAKSGSVPECINFWASPDSMQRLFGGSPQTSLGDGLRHLANYLDNTTIS